MFVLNYNLFVSCNLNLKIQKERASYSTMGQNRAELRAVNVATDTIIRNSTFVS